MLHWGIPVMRYANTPVMLCGVPQFYPSHATWGSPVILLEYPYAAWSLHGAQTQSVCSSSPCHGRAQLETRIGADVIVYQSACLA